MKMNYKKYRMRKEKLANELKESFQNNMDFWDLDLKIKEMGLTTIYKEDNIMFFRYKSDNFSSFFLEVYICIDYLGLDINKTKFDYSLYKKKDTSEVFFKKRIAYNELDGGDLNEKMIALKAIINQKIASVQ